MSLLRKSKSAAAQDMEKRELKVNNVVADNDENDVLNERNNEDFLDLPDENIPAGVTRYIGIGLSSLSEHVEIPSSVEFQQIPNLDFSLHDTENWFDLLKQSSFDPVEHADDAIELDEGGENHDVQNEEFRSSMENRELLRSIAEILGRTDEKNAADVIAQQLGLGKDQQIAFKKIVDHVLEEKAEPLFLFVSGEAGTGKSKVISSIRLFFESSNRSSQYRITASTGTAAAKLYATTIHSFLNLNLSSKAIQNSNWKQNFSLKLEHLQYLIIDEISMIGSKILVKIDSMLKLAKGNQKCFGGVSVIVFGDFFQFSPVKDIPIYHPGSEAYILWTSNFQVVILKENFRQQNDARLLEILRHWKSGKMRPEDWRTLNSRILGRTENKPDINSTPIIVSRNSLRHQINQVFSEQFQGEKFTFDAKDTCSSKNLSDYPILRKQLLNLSDVPLIGQLTIFVSMKVMLTQNIATKIGLSKGTKGRVIGWNNEVILIHSDLDIAQRFPGLEPNVVPIRRTISRFKIQDMKINRSQFPIIPCYCITDYRSQGDTYSSVIIDLRVPPNGGWCLYEAVYVMLSRVSTLDGLFILCEFEKKYPKPPKNLIQEYDRLERLSQNLK
jgi:hypothetical protein